MQSLIKSAGVALATMLLFGASAAQAQQKLRLAGNFAIEHSSSQAMEVFKTELAKLTNGKLTVDVFPAQQLGGAAENVQAVRNGTIEMIWVGMAFLTRTVPELEAVSLPFQYPNRDVAFKVVDGPVGDVLDKKLADKGMLSLGYMELGARQVTNSRRPIKTLEDFKGLKIRLQPNETHLATFRALGANAVAMDIKELYSALEQKVMDGQENPFSIIWVSRYFEVQKYISDTGHFFDFISILANRKAFNSLSPENQQAIRKAMATAIAFQRDLAKKQDAEALEQLRKRGMQFDAVSPQLTADMRKATVGVVEDAKKRAGADLVSLVDQEIAKASK
ncbi:MAG: TRAP transporter substrate-binding protein [Betaproteobacteria bacterium]|nr:TRAP transporter substrate-binding protein [Betaproteobacteria bacterium]